MTLIELFNSYDRWTRFNLMTPNQHSLFFALCRIWNACGRVDWLSVPNSTVAELSGIKNPKTLQNVRNQLIALNLISYKKGIRNINSGRYCIIPKGSPLLKIDSEVVQGNIS